MDPITWAAIGALCFGVASALYWEFTKEVRGFNVPQPCPTCKPVISDVPALPIKPEAIAEVVDVLPELANVPSFVDFSMHPIMGLLCLIVGIILGYQLHSVKPNALKLPELSLPAQQYRPGLIAWLMSLDYGTFAIGFGGAVVVGFAACKGVAWSMASAQPAIPQPKIYTFEEIASLAERVFPQHKVYILDEALATFTWRTSRLAGCAEHAERRRLRKDLTYLRFDNTPEGKQGVRGLHEWLLDVKARGYAGPLQTYYRGPDGNLVVNHGQLRGRIVVYPKSGAVDHSATLFDQYYLDLFSNQYAQTYLGPALYVFLTLALCALLATLAYLLSLSTSQDTEKRSEYECGFAPFDSATRPPPFFLMFTFILLMFFGCATWGPFTPYATVFAFYGAP